MCLFIIYFICLRLGRVECPPSKTLWQPDSCGALRSQGEIVVFVLLWVAPNLNTVKHDVFQGGRLYLFRGRDQIRNR